MSHVARNKKQTIACRKFQYFIAPDIKYAMSAFATRFSERKLNLTSR